MLERAFPRVPNYTLLTSWVRIDLPQVVKWTAGQKVGEHDHEPAQPNYREASEDTTAVFLEPDLSRLVIR